MIRAYVPYHVYENRTENIGKGTSIVLTGLVFDAVGLNSNSFFCDKIIYCNRTTLSYVKKLFDLNETSITDFFSLRDYPSEKFRSKLSAILIRLRSDFLNHIHRIMDEEQFVNVNPPILTSFPLQEDNAFEVKNEEKNDYFYTPVFLSKEKDKHLESIVQSIPQVYTIAHSFTSDQTRSRQVSNEYLSLEIAQATNDKLEDLMNQVEYFIQKLTSTFEKVSKAKELLSSEKYKFDHKLFNFDFIRMTIEECKELLKQKEIYIDLNENLTFYHKRIISEYFENQPVFIYDFPYNLKTDYDTLNINNKVIFQLNFITTV